MSDGIVAHRSLHVHPIHLPSTVLPSVAVLSTIRHIYTHIHPYTTLIYSHPLPFVAHRCPTIHNTGSLPVHRSLPFVDNPYIYSKLVPHGTNVESFPTTYITFTPCAE